MTSPPRGPLPIAVLISGKGSNLQAMLDAIDAGRLHASVRLVASSRAEAEGLDRASRRDIPTAVVAAADHPDRESYDEALRRHIDASGAQLVVLAGFMRILTPAFVRHYAGRMLNVHPSLLPAYRGLHTHARVLEACDAEHGTSVHFVTEELDGGPVVAQARIPVRPGDGVEELTARVQAREHVLYPRVVQWFAEGRLRLDHGRPRLDGRPLEAPEILDWPPGDAG